MTVENALLKSAWRAGFWRRSAGKRVGEKKKKKSLSR